MADNIPCVSSNSEQKSVRLKRLAASRLLFHPSTTINSLSLRTKRDHLWLHYKSRFIIIITATCHSTFMTPRHVIPGDSQSMSQKKTKHIRASKPHPTQQKEYIILVIHEAKEKDQKIINTDRDLCLDPIRHVRLPPLVQWEKSAQLASKMWWTSLQQLTHCKVPLQQQETKCYKPCVLSPICPAIFFKDSPRKGNR